MHFEEWLNLQESIRLDPATVQSWERVFNAAIRDNLDVLIARTRDPYLRAEFEKMKTSFSVARWLLKSLNASNCLSYIDVDDAMQYALFALLSPVGLDGSARRNVFSGFTEDRPYDKQGDNPLIRRIKVSIARLVRTICGQRIPRLKTIQRPPGTVSIGSGSKEEKGVASPEEIAAKPSSKWDELVTDVVHLLEKEQPQYPGIPLVNLFQGILAGEPTRVTRSKYGRTASDLGRAVIIKCVEQMARSTGNIALLRMLDRFKDYDPTRPDPTARQSRYRPDKQPNPQVIISPKDKDFRSIAGVVNKFGGITLSELQRLRRRWLERKPRDPESPHRNRLIDVLRNMEQENVIKRHKTKAGGDTFIPGGSFAQYVDSEPVAV